MTSREDRNQDRNPDTNQGTAKEKSIRDALQGKGVDVKFSGSNWTITKNGESATGLTSVPVAEIVSVADAL